MLVEGLWPWFLTWTHIYTEQVFWQTDWNITAHTHTHTRHCSVLTPGKDKHDFQKSNNNGIGIVQTNRRTRFQYFIVYSLFASFNKLIKFQSAAILLSNVPAYGQSDMKWLGGLAYFPRQFVLQAQEPEVRGKQLQLCGDKARSSLLFFPHTP